MKSVHPLYPLQSVPAIPPIPSVTDVCDGPAIPSGSAIPDGQPSDVVVGWRSAPTPLLRVEFLLLLVIQGDYRRA